MDPITAVKFFQDTLDSSSPSLLIPSVLKFNPESDILHVFGHDIELTINQHIFVIGSGKASVEMAKAVSSVLGSKLSGGMVITNSLNNNDLPENIEVLISSHPFPTKESVQAANLLMDFIKSIPNNSVVLNLVSGGTSSILCKPSSSIPFDDIAKLYRMLLNSGIGIHEMNLVRKSVSEIKAGRLLQYFNDVRLFDLIISDVPNDDLEDIGSGPTIVQRFRYSDVITLLKDKNLWQRIPESLTSFLSTNARENDLFEAKEIANHKSQIILSSEKVATIAKILMEQKGFRVTKDDKPWTGSIDDFEKHILSKITTDIAADKKPHAFIFFGECSVEVTGDGKGGRNQELALRMAKHLDELDQDVIFLSAGTDGIDGPTDAAGAVVDQNSLNEARKLDLDADDFLKRNDSYSFFDKLGGHIKTGPTGNNVMDLQFLIVH
jgi:glycerate-2-kinase